MRIKRQLMHKERVHDMIKKFTNLIRNPGIVFLFFGGRGLFKWMDDETYLKIAYKLSIGRKLDLKNPRTYTEKLQWLKLHDRKNIYTTMVDKYDVKKYVSDIIGDEYIIPTLGIWNNFEEIDFDKLPDKFVLKCTHDSGGIIICENKYLLDKKKVKNKIEKCMNKEYFWQGREWPYKNVKPRIIAEKYMVDKKTRELRDYKFFCFNGKPNMVFVASDRQNKSEDTKFDFFDMDYRNLHIRNGHNNADVEPEKPKNFNKMKELAAKLSKGIPQLRVDFYEVNEKIYFGELTFFHHSGFVPFEPEKWDYLLGELTDVYNI